MRFASLLDLPYNAITGLIDLPAITETVPNTPEPVAAQFFVDHGRDGEFQALYGDLDLEFIRWQLVSLPASALCEASFNPLYKAWLNTVERRADSHAERGWPCIDLRPVVVQHWAQFRTWRTPPVVLSGPLLNSNVELHLVEGHTRLGLLRGLVRAGVIGRESVHEVWLGTS